MEMKLQLQCKRNEPIKRTLKNVIRNKDDTYYYSKINFRKWQRRVGIDESVVRETRSATNEMPVTL
jgi:hypothetical protein